MRRIVTTILIFISSFFILSPLAAATLSNHYTEIPLSTIDSGYTAPYCSMNADSVDLNMDGHQDLIILGSDFPSEGVINYTPQPGRVLLGDGSGNFSIAPGGEFPVDNLMTVHPRKVLFSDFNGDSRPDMFVASHGWDAEPFPGEQNRLMLSNTDGGWRDATSNLPQLSDFTHSAALGDVDDDGDIDIFVGNGYDTDILSYFLINDGQGNLTLDRSIIPVAENNIFGPWSFFPGSILEDLNGDNLPELIITAEATDEWNTLRQNTILWNTDGSYSQNNISKLPIQSVFQNSYIVLDMALIDVNNDNLDDMVVIGTQGKPFYDGWFVQLLINKGNRQFVDETVIRVGAGDRYGGTEGVTTGTSWPVWVKVLDYNHDGFDDFAIELSPGQSGLGQNQPFVWLNDQAGRFTTLKTGDLVSSGMEWRLGNLHLQPTLHGYSIFTQQVYSGSGGLLVTGLLASQILQPPSVTTTTVSNITNTEAKANGEVTNDNGFVVTSRGVSWNTIPVPTILNHFTASGSGAGSFEGNLTGLAANTTYYVRSWATSVAGTRYGNELVFKTNEGLATVVTTSVIKDGNTQAIAGGQVVNDGGVDVTSRGVCWSTVTGPTIADNKTSNGIGMGTFQSQLSNLIPGTIYYVRSYATNSYGTSYGNEVTFTAGAFPWAMFLPAIQSNANP